MVMSVAAAQENIQVAVRIRPATLAERVGSCRHMVKKVDTRQRHPQTRDARVSVFGLKNTPLR